MRAPITESPGSLELFHHHPAKIYAFETFCPRVCSILPSRYRSRCSRPYVNSHHLCTDTAAIHTAVSEVAFLVQNRLSPYITFYRLLSVPRFVTEDTFFTLKNTSIVDSALPSVAVDRRVNKPVLQHTPPQPSPRCLRNRGPPVTGRIPTALKIRIVLSL